MRYAIILLTIIFFAFSPVSTSTYGQKLNNTFYKSNKSPLDKSRRGLEEESPAAFPGGQAALMHWLSSNIRYPEEAYQKGIEGKVTVRFVVEKDGSVSGVTVLKGITPDLDAEAIRLIKRMPKWIPGMILGEPVRSYFTLPVTFKRTNK